MEKQYKLEVKMGKKWSIGNKVYNNLEEATLAKDNLQKLAKEAKKNHKYRIVEL